MSSQAVSPAVPGPGAPPEASALAFDGVSLWRWDARAQEERHLVRDVTWTVRPGEHWALLGPNGAGKTTLMGIAAAATQPSAGTAHVLGARLGRVDVRALRETIGLVEARTGRAFSHRLSARDVVLTGATGSIALQRRRVGDAERSRAEALLRRFGCAAIAPQPYEQCSQGERQRVLLARALMRDPPLLLLDEPATGLDLPGREALLAALASIAVQEPRTATVTVTHHVEELPSSTTHALLLREGRALAAGPVADALTSASLSACFGIDVALERSGDRWAARSRAGW